MSTVFFIAAKLIGALLRPDTWIVIALAVIVLALVLNRRRVAIWVSAITLAVLVALSVFPMGNLLLQPIERTYPANPNLAIVDANAADNADGNVYGTNNGSVDGSAGISTDGSADGSADGNIAGIVVLGGGENARASAYWDQMQFNEGAERYTAALALARRFPEAKVLFVGGSGELRDVAGATISEASIAERFFKEQGIASDRLLFEGQSRNTAENARLSLALANPAPGETWVLVTSAFHMPRAMRSFEAAGWKDLVAWPVDYRTSGFRDGIGWNLTGNLRVLDIAIREYVGQLAYRLTGQ